MVISEYYLSNPSNIETAMYDTGLALDELESLVGRFTGRSQWSGQIRGKVVVRLNKKGVIVEIRHHFNTNKVYWRAYRDE